MLADDETRVAVEALVAATYAALSDPGSDVASLFSHPDIAVAGSGRDELFTGPEEVGAAAVRVSASGLRWTPRRTTVWCRGDVAWAQVLGTVQRAGEEAVPYRTLGVFTREDDGWHWVSWGGSEPV
jgi:hypothetical protein